MRRTCWRAVVSLALMASACDGPRVGTDAGGGDAGTMDGGGDVCEGRTTCTTAGTSCSGDSLVTCAADADGCLVETTTDCGAADQVCDDGGATASCVDPCSLIPTADRCETADARACNGDTLEVCTADADGCLVLQRTDCAGTAGGTCDDGGEMPVCAEPPDPCDGLADACTTAGASCSGDSLVVCAPNAFGCLVETTVDCTSRAGGTCDSSGSTPACTADDPCDGLTECSTAGTRCEGPDLVECAPDAFGCMVESRTTCTDVMFGFCDADGTPPACSTAATDPCMGMVECGTEPGRSCSDASTLSVCAPNAFGCFVTTDTDCTTTSEVCSDASGTAACVDPCSLVTTCASSLSCDGDELVTCAADSDGCLVESDRTACADTCDPAGTPSCVTTSCAPARPGFLSCASGHRDGRHRDGRGAQRRRLRRLRQLRRVSRQRGVLALPQRRCDAHGRAHRRHAHHLDRRLRSLRARSRRRRRELRLRDAELPRRGAPRPPGRRRSTSTSIPARSPMWSTTSSPRPPRRPRTTPWRSPAPRSCAATPRSPVTRPATTATRAAATGAPTPASWSRAGPAPA
ncbi:MAG: hypothetical protein M5U28_11640 [Sandaracinaceae bacterium]|nr:hypothetical protein [Sandaracinaceae bacterium]